MTVFAVYVTDTGRLVSIGSVVANPLPAGITSVALSDADVGKLRTATGKWDEPTRRVVDRDPSEFLPEQNRLVIQDRATQALTANATYLALASPSNAQNLAQIRLLTRECSSLIRMALNQFDTTDGT
jgi:hypothetical protein